MVDSYSATKGGLILIGEILFIPMDSVPEGYILPSGSPPNVSIEIVPLLSKCVK